MTDKVVAGPDGSELSEGLGPLAHAARDVMAHQWSNNRQAMDALTRLIDAACERAARDGKARAALRVLAACIRNGEATYRINNERKKVLAALESVEGALRA